MLLRDKPEGPLDLMAGSVLSHCRWIEREIERDRLTSGILPVGAEPLDGQSVGRSWRRRK